MTGRLDAYAPKALALMRIAAALLFVEAGSFHLFGFPASPYPPPPPEMATLLLVAGVLEFIGGILLLVGLFTRPTAFIMSGMMAVAYWGFHFPMAMFPSQNMGAAAILFCFIYLYLVFAGPGAWSLDRTMRHTTNAALQRPAGRNVAEPWRSLRVMRPCPAYRTHATERHQCTESSTSSAWSS